MKNLCCHYLDMSSTSSMSESSFCFVLISAMFIYLQSSSNKKKPFTMQRIKNEFTKKVKVKPEVYE